MKLRTLMVINTVIAGLFGIAFVLIPGQVLSLYGVQPNPAINYIGELFGAALIGFAVLTWTARNAADSDARTAIVRALFIGDAVGFIVALIAQLGAVVNNLGWSTVIIYLFLAVGFGYFYFTKPSAEKAE
jgi:Na+-driven multidrug efflux pump